ncbi:MAG: hypothetical protein WBQ78_17355 [Gammaproteobacteria bacterium]
MRLRQWNELTGFFHHWPAPCKGLHAQQRSDPDRDPDWIELESAMTKLLMTVVFLGASGLAQAEDISSVPFNDLDVDRDDTLSLSEAGALPEITAQWQSLDQDGDGKLNRGEYAGYEIPAPAAGAKY